MTSALVLAAVLVLFWSFTFYQARVAGRPISFNLLISPVAFLVIGLLLNRYRDWWGTAVVAVIHVMLALLLFQALRRIRLNQAVRRAETQAEAPADAEVGNSGPDTAEDVRSTESSDTGNDAGKG